MAKPPFSPLHMDSFRRAIDAQSAQFEHIQKLSHSPIFDAIAKAQINIPNINLPTISLPDNLISQAEKMAELCQLSSESTNALNAMSRLVGDAAKFHYAFDQPEMASWIGSIEAIKAAESLRLDQGVLKAFETLHERSINWQKAASRIAAGFQPLDGPLKQFTRELGWLQQEEQVVVVIEQLGFVPHAALWGHVTEIDVPTEETAQAQFSEQLVANIWPQLEERLAVGEELCLGDHRLFQLYTQMLEAHKNGLYECVCSTLVTILERTAQVAQNGSRKLKASQWLKQEVGGLPSDVLGGMRGYRVWLVLVEHVFDSCWEDLEADMGRYPNRHARAHGIGAKVATSIDSLNAILLAHFVIGAASKIKQYRDSSEQPVIN